MAIKRVALFGATLLSFLCGCSGMHGLTSSSEAAVNFAASHGFERRIYRVGGFEITSFVRKPALSRELTVYIEGDGAPWHRSMPPRDPTPRRLIVLQLAAKDDRNPVLYLARPCQFLEEDQLQRCSADYWTDSRYSGEVIVAFDMIITQAMHEYGASRLNLVGYSGGGTIALYLAGRRNDVARLTTIASPLNPALWTEYHGISPLTGSSGEVEAWQKLEKVQQFHLVGEKDSIVPPALMKSMLPPGVKPMVIQGYDHECCWVRDWEKLLAETGSLKISN